MRRISLFLITVMIIMNFSCFAPVFAQEEAEPVDMTAAGLLSELEIVAMPEDTEDYLTEVTRADFAVYVAAMIGIDGYAVSEERYYTDVPMDHWGLTSINELTKRGVLSGYMGKFRPSDIITAEEAVKVLAMVLGYTASDIYPGSIPKSISNELLVGVSNKSGGITLSDAVTLLYNTLRADTLTTYIVGADYHKTKTDGNLLGMVYDLYEISGIVTEVYGISTDGNPAGDNDTVRIENQRFECNIQENLNKFLGRYVKAYYYDDGDNPPEMILIYNQSDRVQEAVFGIEDFGSFNPSTRTITYYRADKSKEASLSVPKNTVYLKNGKDVTSSFSTCFNNLTQGTIEVVLSDEYSVVIIREYYNVTVGHVNAEELKLFDKYNADYSIKIDENDDRRYTIWGADGNVTAFSEIASGNILSVFEMPEYTDIYISAKTVSGEIEQIQTKKDIKILTVNSVKYRMDKDLSKADRGKSVAARQKLTLYLDVFGKVANVSEYIAEDMLFGYIMEAGIEESSFDDTLMLKVLTQNGEIKGFECAEKVKIDGGVEDTCADQETALKTNNNGIANQQLVRYKTNVDGRICEIDTAYEAEKEDKNTTLSPYQKGVTGIYTTAAKNIGRLILMDDETVIFGVPSKDNFDKASDKDFLVAQLGDFGADEDHVVDAYKINNNLGTVDVVVVFDKFSQSTGTLQRELFLVEEKSTVYDAELDESVNVVNGLVEGTEKQYREAELLADGFSFNSINPGDLIRVYSNAKDEIGNIEKYYDFKSKECNVTADTKTNWKNLSIEYGYVINFHDTIMTLSLTPDGSVSQVADVAGTQIMVYDTRGVNPVCRKGTTADIIEAWNLDSLVYIRRRFAAPKCIVVYLANKPETEQPEGNQ